MKKYAWIAAAVIVLDQLTKYLAREITADIALIPGVIGLTYAENTGMAFSMFSGRSWLLGVISAAVIVVGWLILRRYRLGAVSGISAMLMLGGAAGNMIDRLMQGYVVDMIEVLLFRFAIFNVADMALTVGCGLMALSLLICPEDWREKDAKD